MTIGSLIYHDITSPFDNVQLWKVQVEIRASGIRHHGCLFSENSKYKAIRGQNIAAFIFLQHEQL